MTIQKEKKNEFGKNGSIFILLKPVMKKKWVKDCYSPRS
jgi:hypothetical protein